MGTEPLSLDRSFIGKDYRSHPQIAKAEDMIRDLVADQGLVAETARALFSVAEEAGDQASADLAVRRIEVAEKNAWMLRVHLED